MKLSHLLEKVNVLRIAGEANDEVFSICFDSQRCGADSMFVAIPGFSRDGHVYIPDAVARGAGFIVHENDFKPPKGIVAIKVENARRALGILGKNFFRNPSAEICLIGVVGTNGKTTVTYLLENILKSAGFNVGVLGTVNYRYNDKILPAPNTTPESFEFQRILREMADSGITHVIAEVSSHAVDLRRVDDCAFDLGIFTNFTQDHLDYHETMEKYFQAKLRFFKEVLPRGGKPGPRKMIVNGDDPWGQRVLKESSGEGLTYGLEDRDDVRAEIISLSSEGITAKIQTESDALAFVSPLIGRFNLYNIAAAVAASLALQVPKEFIKKGVETISGVPGRLERVSTPAEPAVFVDYAHTGDALMRVLHALSELKRGRIITVFGCGGNRDRGKRPIMGKAASAYSDIVIITSDNPRGEEPWEIIREIEAGLVDESIEKLAPDKISRKREGKSYTIEPDRGKAIALAVGIADAEDTVLIAGKGHEDYQIVGERRFPFDDRKAAREALDGKRNGPRR